MRLRRARVTNYRSIDDSGWVSIDNVTCLVGKNESGKTAFLQALRRLNPVSGSDADFDLKDYPRKGYVRYRRSHKDAPATVVRCEFQLSGEEMADIETAFGPNVLNSPRVIASKGYDNRLRWEPDVDEHTFVQPWQVLEDHLSNLMPQFVYFDDYSAMKGRISIEDLDRRATHGGYLDDADRTFLSLLSLVQAELADLQDQSNYEHLKAELESAAIGISDEIFEFWNQNSQLRVQFDLSNANPNDHPPLNSGTILHVRIWNDRHRVSVPFDERSKGFVWFFSFLAYFSMLEAENCDLVLLLDEPGLNLHATAQTDFLRFIDSRLAPKNQVIYTTHSPSMISLDKLSRIRMVQDLDHEGTVISEDILSNDQEAVYPLQVALGHQMAQTLFLAPNCLMVNSPSDLIYLQVLGEVLASDNGSRLDPRWVTIPVGGADNLPAFVSLLGESYVSVAVLMDVTPKHRERVDRLSRFNRGHGANPIKWVQVTKVRDSDLEDLFDPDFYLKVVNAAYRGELSEDLTMRTISGSNPRIVERISTYFEAEGLAGGRFDPYRPAAYLLENHIELRAGFDDATLQRATSLFERINSMLPSFNGSSANGSNGVNGRSRIPALSAR
jgi:energy-coupling factor transporter ATP-binding protein EcfA2